jgi:hypothetical protein
MKKKIGIYAAKGIGRLIKTKKYPRGSDIWWRADLDTEGLGKPISMTVHRKLKRVLRKEALEKKRKFYNWS